MTPPSPRSNTPPDMYWLSKSPSERKLGRLQRIYGQIKEQSNNNEPVTPIWRTSVRMSVGAAQANGCKSPRCSIARVLGNQYSKQNMVSGPPNVTVSSGSANTTTSNTPLVTKGRIYGNEQSLRNVQSLQQRQQHSHCNSSSACIAFNATNAFGNYYNLKNRLILLDEQRVPLMQLYGRNRFLDEYTDLLQQCWHFEQQHNTVLPFAQVKIQAMLSELQKCATTTTTKSTTKPTLSRPITPKVAHVLSKPTGPPTPRMRRHGSNAFVASTTKSPASTKSLVTKRSVKNAPSKDAIVEPELINVCDPTQVIGLTKHSVGSNLVERNVTPNGSQAIDLASGAPTSSFAHCSDAAEPCDNVELGSNLSIAMSPEQAPSVLLHETDLLGMPCEMLLPYFEDDLCCTDSERAALEKVVSYSSSDQVAFTAAQHLCSGETLSAVAETPKANGTLDQQPNACASDTEQFGSACSLNVVEAIESITNTIASSDDPQSHEPDQMEPNGGGAVKQSCKMTESRNSDDAKHTQSIGLVGSRVLSSRQSMKTSQLIVAASPLSQEQQTKDECGRNLVTNDDRPDCNTIGEPATVLAPKNSGSRVRCLMQKFSTENAK